ncbi:F0F1 ATP synthase subunit B [Cesiribacter andamanensis]|uniref:ATP synthase subunit b n=1 Tax=Cesiribacter andamanensis AMV16 TaxID=1279009 RepID=M7N3F9_9BACT|nr:F0F1 ATP synthase subunit B [Cesiribacter andamanensis]EMR01817.1 F-type ATPase subunit b [Cesiribacter andamanensis AMV16]
MELVNPGIGLIIWTAITFIVVLLLLRTFAWKPILEGLRQREDFIDESIRAAETAKAEMANLKAENERLIDEARAERERIIREANVAAKNLIEEAKGEAQKQAQRQLEEARIAINTEKQAAMADVKRQVALLSLDIAEKLLRKELSNEAAQKALVQDYVSELKVN